MEKLTPEEALDLMQGLAISTDPESAHQEADQVLLALLRFYNCPVEIIDLFNGMKKWYA